LRRSTAIGKSLFEQLADWSRTNSNSSAGAVRYFCGNGLLVCAV
jgi:hypothetical protein